jgi:hypothetical protein
MNPIEKAATTDQATIVTLKPAKPVKAKIGNLIMAPKVAQHASAAAPSADG